METPQSKARASSSILPRIETQDQFQARFRQIFRGSCLSSRELDWVKTIFEKFSSTSQVPVCWNTSDLIKFMEVTLPQELKSDLTRAGPLLFRCVQRLGSFPWHNQPLQVQDIDLDTLVTAVVILLRRYESNLYPFVVTKSWSLDNPQEIDGNTQQDQWLHKLLFQCMSVVSDTPEEADVEESVVKEIPDDQVIVDKLSDDSDSGDVSNVVASDDDHLLQAHALVSARNRYRSEDDEKNVFTYGPPIIELTALPSSKSQDLRGLIPNDEFESLLKILLACQLYLCGSGPENLCANGGALDKLTSTAFSGFSQSGIQPGITWNLFNSGLTTIVPNIFSALPRLFASFILDQYLDHDLILSSTKTVAASLIREAFRQTQSSNGRNESVLDALLLVKLATILPVDLPLQTASVISTISCEDFNLNPIRDQIQSKNQPLLLLVKGFASSSTSSDFDDTEVVVGAFLPHNATPSLSRRQNACVFQLSNELLSVHCSEVKARYFLDEGVHKFQIQTLSNDLAELSLNEKTEVARLFVPRSDGRPAATLSKIRIASIDLVGFSAGKSRLQMSSDNSFYVPSRAILPTRILPLSQTRQYTAAEFSFLSIITSALALVVIYQLCPNCRHPSNSLPSLPGAIFDFLWSSSVALGTPFIAWNVVFAENRNSVAISIAIALASVLTVAIVQVGSLLLWGPIVAWWIAGVLLLSRDRWEVGAWWFRAVLAAKVVELTQNR
ncbi:hypothetical protein BKA65DRAFT_601680 [Rhexocercosporidium sp. MPI-PUGE-AT-0058]|nr:hypothetical protein BKA65DRAFT_601680 [Rhexocercosporidium sp. MPI-PUGE-AT-0058]